jgi:RNA polymerase sigma-70 factor, ECF subfamily
MEKPTILYIEDEPDYQVLVAGILGEAGFRTETADTGDDGLDRLTRTKPNLILLDVNLPDVSGYVLCSRIRQEESWAEIPIMMLTVRRRPNEWLEGFSSGADDYLSKPFNPPELIERVQAALTGKPMRRLNPNDPENLLIEAALAGNRSAFEVLITRYKQPLASYVRQTIGNDAAAEDIVAASFTRAFQRLDRFRGDATFFTWLFTIADNQMCNYWERQNRIAPYAFDEAHGTPAAMVADVADNPTGGSPSETVTRLRHAVRQLPSEFRQPLRMHCLNGLPVQSVARRLRLPLGTVLSRIHRAKAALREAVEKFAGPDDL